MKIELPFPTFNLSIQDAAGKYHLIQNLPSVPAIGDFVMIGDMKSDEPLQSGYVAGRRLWDFTSYGDTNVFVVSIRLEEENE